MISNSLIWSGIFVGSFLVIIFSLWFAIFIYKYQQLKKFKNNGGNVLEQINVYLIVIGLFGFALGLYLISLIMGIVYLTKTADMEASAIPGTDKNLGIAFQVIFLLYMSVIFSFLVILLIYQNTIIMVFKNGTLLTMSAIVEAKTILQIRRDNKRRWIFINWKDPKEKRIREIKLKYTYKVKDYLKENGLWQEQEPIK